MGLYKFPMGKPEIFESRNKILQSPLMVSMCRVHIGMLHRGLCRIGIIDEVIECGRPCSFDVHGVIGESITENEPRYFCRMKMCLEELGVFMMLAVIEGPRCF